MNEARDEKTVTVYTPAMSLQEMQELRDLWAETAPHIPFVQLSGLMSGVVLTDNARASKAPMILDVNDVPERLRQLIVLYEDDVCGLIEAETLTPPDEVLTDLSGTALRGWMSGMGTAVGMNFQKFMAVMASPKEFGDIALIAMGFLAFAPQPLEDPLFNDVFSGQEQRFKETRDDFLQNWDKEPPAERQKVLNEMIAGLGFGYGLAQAITESINAKHAEEGFPHDWSSVTVRREGRKIRPNEPCPCGSGKKYKKCHGAPGAPALPQEE